MKKKNMAALALALTCLPGLVFGQKDLKIQINGKTVESKPAAFVEDNRTLVPLRFVAENLDYQVTWFHTSQEILISKENPDQKSLDRVIYLKLGQKEAFVLAQEDLDAIYKAGTEEKHQREKIIQALARAKKVPLDVKPVIREERTFVPLRVVVELLQEKISWDQENYTIKIQAKEVKTDEEIAYTMLYTKLSSDYKKPPYKLFAVEADDFNPPIKTNFYRFDLVEDHPSHRLTLVRYGVDLNKGHFYSYDVNSDQWILDPKLN